MIFPVMAPLAAAAFVWSLLWLKLGGKDYFRALKVLALTAEENKAYSERLFAGGGEGDKHHYGGIYMGALADFIPGVWIWGKGGPHFFRPDEHTVYSRFQLCLPEALGELEDGKPVTPPRSVDTDIRQWKDKLRAGDFITVLVAAPGQGGTAGRLREAFAYDWWLFDTVTFLKDICKR